MADMTRDQFSREVIDIVRNRFPLAKVGRAEQVFSLRLNGRVSSLENLYRMILLSPKDIKKYVERWAVELLRDDEGTPDKMADFDAVKGKIMPVVLSPDDSDVRSGQVMINPVVEGLNVTYALDGDRTIAYLPETIIKSWNITLDDLHKIAIDNLVAKSQAIPAHAAQDDDGNVTLVLFQTLDGYDASRLLLPSLYGRLHDMLGNTFAAAIPNRDILLCFRQDAETLERIRQQVDEDYKTMPYKVTDKLFMITQDGVSPLI